MRARSYLILAISLLTPIAPRRAIAQGGDPRPASQDPSPEPQSESTTPESSPQQGSGAPSGPTEPLLQPPKPASPPTTPGAQQAAPVTQPATPQSTSPNAPPSTAAAAAASVVPPPAASEAESPVAGFTGDVPFLRSRDGSLVLLPSGRLQVDSVWFSGLGDRPPFDSFMAKRARFELGGWVGPWVSFAMSAEAASGPPAAGQSQLITMDAFVAISPLGDLVVLQVGQYNVPFTFENRSTDKYIDFVERSMTVRALAVPAVRDQGAMLQGVLPRRSAHYSIAVLNGEGQNFRNADNQFDLMGRGWVAPFTLVPRAWAQRLSRITVGGSLWTGRRPHGLIIPAQTTLGGVEFWSPRWTTAGDNPAAMELRQYGRQNSWALELDAPITNRIGARAEYVNKHQQLIDVDVSRPSVPVTMGNATLDGWAAYGQVWAWIVGDDRILPVAGMAMPPRVPNWTAPTVLRHGLMAVARFEWLHDDLTIPSTEASLGDPSQGTTRVWSLQLGLNYWYSKRFRATVNYAYNSFDGSASRLQQFPGDVHELLTRLAIAL